MKKIYLLLVIIISCVLLVSCGEEKQTSNYNVTFTYDGSVAYKLLVDENDQVSIPDTPSKENYSFKYWRVAGTNVEAVFPYTITKDTVFIAEFNKYFQAKFIVEGEVYQEINNLKQNSYIEKPADPTKNGYIFIGWKTESTGNIVNFPYLLVNRDLTLTASFKVKPITIWDVIEDTDTFDYSAPVTINFNDSLFGGVSESPWNNLLDDFMIEYPNITVVQKTITVSSVTENIEKYPGVTEIRNNYISSIDGNFNILPLNNFITNPNFGYSESELNDFVSGYLDESSNFDISKTYLDFPLIKKNEVLFYNKTFFSEHNLVMPKNPSWNDIQTLSNKIKLIPGYENVTPFNYDISPDFVGSLFLNGAASKNIPYASFNESGTYDLLFNNKGAKEMVKYYKGLADNNILNVSSLGSESHLNNLFRNGELPMYVSTSSNTAFNVPQNGSFEVGVVTTPQFNTNNRKFIQSGSSLVISKSTNKQQRIASWLLIKYLTSPEVNAKIAIRGGYVPVRNSSYDSTVWKNYEKENKNNFENTVSSVIYQTIKISKDERKNVFSPINFSSSQVNRDQLDKLVLLALSSTSKGAEFDLYLDSLFEGALSNSLTLN